MERILGRKGRRSGGKKANRDRDLNRERGETILGRKREKIWKGLKGKKGKDLNGERRQRILRRSREKISAGGKALGRKGGKGSQQGKEKGKISVRKGRRSQAGKRP